MKIAIIYHCFLINNWNTILKYQLCNILNSNLYYTADIIYISAISRSEEDSLAFKLILSFYPKINYEIFYDNYFEYYGIKKVYELAHQYKDLNILYFHSKGVFNRVTSFNTMDEDYRIITGVKSWVDLMVYFLIFKYEECIKQLVHYNFISCFFAWPKLYCANFWWTTSEYIRTLPKIRLETNDKNYYENWIWSNSTIRPYNRYNITWNPYISIISSIVYEERNNGDDEIIINSAYYGNFLSNTNVNRIIAVNVTNKIRSLLKYNNTTLDFICSNDVLGGDPCINEPKILDVHFRFKNNSSFDTIIMAQNEDQRFYFSSRKK